jgi:hypothetical protein
MASIKILNGIKDFVLGQKWLASAGRWRGNKFLIISDPKDQSRFLTQDSFLDDFASPRDVLKSFALFTFDGSSNKRSCRQMGY